MPSTPDISVDALLDSIRDGVVIVGKDGVVVRVNRAGRNMLGRPEKTENARLIDLAKPTQPEQADKLTLALKRGEHISALDIDIELHDGRKSTVEISCGPLHGGGSFTVISFRDVTAARATSRENRRNREFLEHLVDGSSDAIVASDMRGQLVVFNRAAERLFGIPAAEAQARLKVVDIYPAGGAREMMRLIRASPTGHVDAVRTFGMSQTGELLPMEVSASVVKINDEEVATVGLMRDLRERVRVENELTRTRGKLADAEKQAAITALAGATAHELNQPLTAILGGVHLLRRKVDPQLVAQLDAIGTQVERMAEIVKRISRLTRVETVEYPGDRRIADLMRSTTEPDNELRPVMKTGEN